jgi:ribosomal protein S18 acetylase RimI-like enzyme
MTLELSFCKAELQDTEQMTVLINSAYRGESSRQGWTTEADLLEGLRTDSAEISRLITSDDSLFVLGKIDSVIQASVHLQNTHQGVYIGMFAVNPLFQGQGIGKALLQMAEQEAQRIWSANQFVMVVISSRHELIAFYERRGYRHTGINKAFPINSPLWTVKVPNLHLIVLEKPVS